jgi:hypothetical protein
VPGLSGELANLIADVPVRHTPSSRPPVFCGDFAGTFLALNGVVDSVFSAGSELVRWHLVAMSADGPYRLTVHHARGTIVEYFTTTDAALKRQHELERLLIAAGGSGSPIERIAS